MVNPNNLTVSFLVAFISLLLFNVVVSLHDAAPAPASNDVISTTCSKTSNSSLCFSVLKSAGSTDLVTLDYYTLNLTHKIAVDTFRLTEQLAMATTNPLLKERYAFCLQYGLDRSVRLMKEGKDKLNNRLYLSLSADIYMARGYINMCLDDFNDPSSDPSSFPMMTKYLRDMVDIAASITFILCGDDV